MPRLDPSVLRDALAYVDRWIAFRCQYRDLPGLVIAVRSGDEPVFARAYGFANLESRVPMTTEHVFRIASHSKTFTATAIMQLVERGRLRLDDRASTYVPWFTSDATVRQLLNHVGGLIRDGVDADFWRVEQPFPDLDALRALAPESAILDANARFKYSNIGYALLGLVIEAVAGVPYNQYVKEHIVDRLGLRSTGPELDTGLGERMVTGYTGHVLGVPSRAVPAIDTHALSAATGFYSTAPDLCQYAAAHWLGDQTLLSDASKRELQHPNWDVEQTDERYGLGFTTQKIGARTLVGHGGGFPGQSTRTLIDPEDRLVVVVLSNTQTPDGLAGPLATEIVRIIDFAHDKGGRTEAEPGVSLDRFTGRFANVSGAVDVAAFGRALVALAPHADDPVRYVTDLELVDEDRLRIAATGGYGSAGEIVRYERDEQGNTTRVVAAGLSLYPEAAFVARYADQPRWGS